MRFILKNLFIDFLLRNTDIRLKNIDFIIKQSAFAEAVFKAAGSKPVIVLLCNGGAVSIDDLITPAAAIVEVAICNQIDEFCIKTDGFCTKNDDFNENFKAFNPAQQVSLHLQ